MYRVGNSSHAGSPRMVNKSRMVQHRTNTTTTMTAQRANKIN